MKALAGYFANLTLGRRELWCYLIWYLVVLVHYFDPSPRLWLTSLGLAAIIGTALYISSTTHSNKIARWQIIRLLMMPFFVSSFAALVKWRGFVLVFSPDPREVLLALGLCALFCATVWILKRANV
jgi:peptidoglycan/LPS O-acetylase OafA/YrhL